jgi:hypothetical protein
MDASAMLKHANLIVTRKRALADDPIKKGLAEQPACRILLTLPDR